MGRGGNAITLSLDLYREMQALAGLDGSEGALANALALKQVVERRRAAGRKPLVFAMTYPFSSHNYEFRFWLAAAGINPDTDVTMTVVPPPLTVDAMTTRAIDGFCVNAPWNMIAVEKGIGRMVATKADIWPSAPEKVLGVSPEWAEENPETLSRLVVALDAAARWCDARENHAALADMMSDQAYLGVPSGLILRLFSGQLTVDPDGRVRHVENYLRFYGQAANFPWISQALWIYSQMVRWGQVAHSEANLAQVEGRLSSRSLSRHTWQARARPCRVSTARSRGWTETFIDGRSFSPDDIPAYVEGFPIRTAANAAVDE